MRTRRLAVLALLLVALQGAAAAAPAELERADRLARGGAYRAADDLYRAAWLDTLDDREKLRLQLRRLAVAEALGDVTGIQARAEAVERAPGFGASVEAQLRVALARGGLAVRMGWNAEARRQLERAEGLAARLDTREARLARYIVATWRYGLQVSQQGRPTPQAFVEASGRALAPVLSLAATETTEPLAMMRAASWGRFWVRQPMLYMADAWRDKDMGAAAAWCKVAADLAMAGRASLYAGAGASGDAEARYAAQLYALDVAGGVYGNAAAAEPWLATVSRELEVDERLAREVARGEGTEPVFVELLRVRSLYHRTRGLVALAAATPRIADGRRAYEQALQDSRAAGLLLDVIDIRNEMAGVELTLGGGAIAAAPLLQETVQASRRLAYPYGLCAALYWQGRVSIAQGDLAAAERDLREAVELSERLVGEVSAGEQGRREMQARAGAVYELLIDVLVRQGRIAEAVEMGDRQRQSAVLAGLDVSRVRVRTPEVADALAELTLSRERAAELAAAQTAQAELAQVERHVEVAGGGGIKVTQMRPLPAITAVHPLADNRAQFYQALNRIRAVDPDYERLVNIRPTSFSKLQPRLPADALLVQYYVSTDRLYVFTATRDALRIHLVEVGRAAVEADVATVRTSFADAVRHPGQRLDAEAEAALVRLHGWLIGPLEADLAKAKVLLVVPGGPLYYLPFSALAVRRGGTLEYLVQRVPVVVLTSLELLDVVAGRASAPLTSLLALGNPDGTLPGAQQEVTEVATLFKAPRLYLADQATRQQLEKVPPGTSIVHLATHGVLNPRDLNLSYVVLAGRGEAGRLTTGEIYGLDLRGVSLVTLSACQTALGGASPGAEIATLAQAFSVAGSRSMLASLWSVSDAATRTLMVGFYRNLVGGRNLAVSLQEAQKAMLTHPQTAHPALWSAFELIGDWR